MAASLRIPELERLARALCRLKPNLLSYRGDSLAQKWDSLCCATEQQPTWRKELQDLQMLLGRLYTTLPVALRHHQRLSYLTVSQDGNAALGRDPKTMVTWLKMPASNFDDICPGNKPWLKLNQSN